MILAAAHRTSLVGNFSLKGGLLRAHQKKHRLFCHTSWEDRTKARKSKRKKCFPLHPYISVSCFGIISPIYWVRFMQRSWRLFYISVWRWKNIGEIDAGGVPNSQCDLCDLCVSVLFLYVLSVLCVPCLLWHLVWSSIVSGLAKGIDVFSIL